VRFPSHETPTQPPLLGLDPNATVLRVCGSTHGIEASRTGPHGIGQKSPDTSAIPICAKHHRTGPDSYHRLGPRKFSAKHDLNIPAIVRRLNLKPIIRVEAGFFVAYLGDQRYVLCKTDVAFARPSVRLYNSAERLKGPMRLPPDDGTVIGNPLTIMKLFAWLVLRRFRIHFRLLPDAAY
jgi:hypothetical protein